MTTRVIARRSGKWWAIEVPDHPGVFTQARRLEQVQAMAADALSAWLEERVSPEDIEVETHADSDVESAITAAQEARSRAEKARADASTATRQAVARALKAGLPLRDIGRMLGVTHQRAAAIAREIR